LSHRHWHGGAGFDRPLAERMIDIRKDMITAQRHSDKIKTFEDWHASRAKA